MLSKKSLLSAFVAILNLLPKTGNIYILKQTTTLGILAEIGFLSNGQDLAALQKDEHLDEIAYAIFQGIDDFVKILE